MRKLVTVDDLWHPDQLLDQLVPIKEKVNLFRVTCYAIPNKLGPIHELKMKYPWIVFAQHGWEHTNCECAPMTREELIRMLELGQKMGYEKLFKAPNWIHDVDLELACKDTGTILHHHEKYTPTVEGLRVFSENQPQSTARWVKVSAHFYSGLVPDHIKTHPGFNAEALRWADEFITPLDVYREIAAGLR